MTRLMTQAQKGADIQLPGKRPIPSNNRASKFYRRKMLHQRYSTARIMNRRASLFGLQSGGRVESILMSMPPSVRWQYNWSPEAGTEEEKLYSYFLQSRDWLNE